MTPPDCYTPALYVSNIICLFIGVLIGILIGGNSDSDPSNTPTPPSPTGGGEASFPGVITSIDYHKNPNLEPVLH